VPDSRRQGLLPVSTRRRHDLSSLLEVAAAVFTERGYDGTSMEDLSRATGLSKSSLYHHIRSKDQLLRLALERAVEPLFAVIAEPPASEGPALARLEYVIRREVEVLADRLPYVTLLLRVHGNTETERWALERRREFDRFVAGVVAEAVAEGHVRNDIEPFLVTRLLFGMVNSLVDWYRPARPNDVRGAGGPRSQLPPGALADELLAVVFDGLRTRD
jgi:AcrR family transcriptional regulator